MTPSYNERKALHVWGLRRGTATGIKLIATHRIWTAEDALAAFAAEGWVQPYDTIRKISDVDGAPLDHELRLVVKQGDAFLLRDPPRRSR